MCDGMSQVFFTRVFLLLWKTCCTEKVLYFQISTVYGPIRLFETTNAHLIPMPKKIEGLLMSLKSVLTFISCPDILGVDTKEPLYTVIFGFTRF